MAKVKAKTLAALQRQLELIDAQLSRFTRERGSKPIRSEEDLAAAIRVRKEELSKAPQPAQSS